MRLPTRTVTQQRQEEARAFHEDLWRAYREPQIGRVMIRCAPRQAAREMVQLSGRLHGFWFRRGYRLRCKQLADHLGFYVWIEKIADGRAETAA